MQQALWYRQILNRVQDSRTDEERWAPHAQDQTDSAHTLLVKQYLFIFKNSKLSHPYVSLDPLAPFRTED